MKFFKSKNPHSLDEITIGFFLIAVKICSPKSLPYGEICISNTSENSKYPLSHFIQDDKRREYNMKAKKIRIIIKNKKKDNKTP